ncbi:JAB domain-containing protein [Clostridium paraputrificum]|uniref:JAB domain-containing protein n=1 Tax=Clostridium paraputrificum TaxID=29363 RepID=UPI00189C7B45|nr:DNA repair protein RadC [Clostridium paraputrificum]
MEKINIVSVKLVKEGDMLVVNKSINSPSVVYEVLKEYLEGADREKFVLLTLNTKNHITSITTVSVGSLSETTVHPREVFKTAILLNSASIIVCHNHPSGDSTPSKADINVTTRIKEGGKILGIELLDHIIIGDDNYCSFKAKGLI